MTDIVNSNVAIKQPAMRIQVLILTVEEETAATLRVKVPKQNAQPAFGKETSKVYGCCGLTDATFDVIYGDLFQKLKLVSNRGLN